MTPSLHRRGQRLVSAAGRHSNGLFWADWDGTVMEQRGATRGKGSTRRRPENGLNYRQTVATGCHLLPFGSHGKQGVCRGLPPVAGGPLPEKEGVEFTDARAVGQESGWAARVTAAPLCDVCYPRARVYVRSASRRHRGAPRARAWREYARAYDGPVQASFSASVISAEPRPAPHGASVAGPRRRATTPTRASAMSFYRRGRLRDEPRRLGGSRCRSWRPS